MGQIFAREEHTDQDYEENNIDPDDGNSWPCIACGLPIFSTPFKHLHQTNVGGGGGGGGEKLLLHDTCSDLPKNLIGHVLHPRDPLILEKDFTSTTNNVFCDNCERKCGSMFYQCPNDYCNFRLDMLCALQIVKILHRSHQHRLTVIKGPASFNCSACGTQHQGLMSDLSYSCHLCGFWIHPDCASLPNAIILHAKHQHSLFLTYNPSSGSNSAGSSKQDYTCAICGGNAQGVGVYFCGQCHYYAHINCAVMSDPPSFKSVSIQEAKLAGLRHLPMADEYTSVMQHIVDNITSGGKLFKESLHQHTLHLHGDQDGGDDHRGKSSRVRVCNACVQPISPPFYSCSECPDFYLHDCCANLPSEIKHPAHRKHKLFFSTKAPKSSISGLFKCNGCWCYSNRFAYSCNHCDFVIDIVCALMPPSITHVSHGKTHILSMSYKEDFSSRVCNCCNLNLVGICYKCSNCPKMKLHVRCALIPNTTKHIFDEHVLKLTTGGDRTVYSKKVQQLCQICENDIQSEWYYSCTKCEQSFHYGCIPSVNDLSRIKLGATIRVKCHDCPLSLILESSVSGYRCGCCYEAFSSDCIHQPAYECSKCYYRIHEHCAEEEYLPEKEGCEK